VITVPHEHLTTFAATVFEQIGMAPADAAFAAGVIVASDLAGHDSHGMRRLPEYVARWRDGLLDPAGAVTVELDTGAVLRVHGGNGLGHVVLRDVTDLAIERARAHGIAAVALYRSSHAGRFADYCERAAAQGIAILFFVNDAGGYQDVAPAGGLDARLATNPIAAGIPRASSPHLVLDMSTSVVAKGRLMEERDRGTAIPDSWITAHGAIRPAGGVKGFGLALVAEALAGVLTGAGSVSADPPYEDQGVLAIALDIERLRPLGDFTSELERMIGYVRDVPLEPGADAVRMPGESGALATSERLRAGVPVQPHTWQALLALAADLGLAPPAT
jgi:LDH2 family malate/lactate/ureidoglycolate dehydrogenase